MVAAPGGARLWSGRTGPVYPQIMDTAEEMTKPMSPEELRAMLSSMRDNLASIPDEDSARAIGVDLLKVRVGIFANVLLAAGTVFWVMTQPVTTGGVLLVIGCFLIVRVVEYLYEAWPGGGG